MDPKRLLLSVGSSSTQATPRPPGAEESRLTERAKGPRKGDHGAVALDLAGFSVG